MPCDNISDTYTVIRLRETVRRRRWFMHLHGLHGSLRSLPLGYALELVESGRAKLPAGQSLHWLRAAVANAEAAEAAA